jgi:hypothetical protein
MPRAEQELRTGFAIAIHVAVETAPEVRISVAGRPFVAEEGHLEPRPCLS